MQNMANCLCNERFLVCSVIHASLRVVFDIPPHRMTHQTDSVFPTCTTGMHFTRLNTNRTYATSIRSWNSVRGDSRMSNKTCALCNGHSIISHSQHMCVSGTLQRSRRTSGMGATYSKPLVCKQSNAPPVTRCIPHIASDHIAAAVLGLGECLPGRGRRDISRWSRPSLSLL